MVLSRVQATQELLGVIEETVTGLVGLQRHAAIRGPLETIESVEIEGTAAHRGLPLALRDLELAEVRVC
jgi:hypothetical protein